MKLSLLVTLVTVCMCMSCASRPPARARTAAPTVFTSASAPVVVREREEDRQTRMEREAADVFRSIRADLFDCFVRLAHVAQSFITVNVIVGPNGAVRGVETSGEVRPATRTCIERRISRTTFPPPYGGGTARVSVPFAFSWEP